VRIMPDRFEKIYNNWLENIKVVDGGHCAQCRDELWPRAYALLFMCIARCECSVDMCVTLCTCAVCIHACLCMCVNALLLSALVGVCALFVCVVRSRGFEHQLLVAVVVLCTERIMYTTALHIVTKK
jgi:hypothetical protein